MMPMHSGAMGYSSFSNNTSTSNTGGTSSSLSTSMTEKGSSTPRQDFEFDFPSVAFPPRLKDFGRKLSQMSNDFLPPSGPASPEERSTQGQAPAPTVPFMGDDPVMCPFCNKPLPPSLLASQLAAHNASHNHRVVRRPTASRRTSEAQQSRSATPRSGSRVTTPQQTLLDPLPVGAPPAPAAPAEPVPKTTSEELGPTVKEGDVANHTAAETIISQEDMKRWSSFTGVTATGTEPVPSTSNAGTNATSTTAVPQTPAAEKKKEAQAKPFPLLPPPPPPAERQTSPSRTRFGFFGKSKAEDDESDDDDGAVGGGGYSKLTAPGSPTDDEGDGGKKGKKGKQVEKKDDVDQTTTSASDNVISSHHVQEPAEMESAAPAAPLTETIKTKEVPGAAAPAITPSNSEGELRKILQEVLGRVDQLSKSHNDLLSSHSTLLTSLKIARSNLAMAEANTEMLEAQLKRSAGNATPVNNVNVNRAVSGPAKPQTPVVAPAPTPKAVETTPKAHSPQSPQQQQAPAPSQPQPSRASADQPRVATASTATATTKPAGSMGPPVAAPVPKRISLDDNRPKTLHLTANDLLHTRGTGPHSASASSSAEDGSKSWGFWNGGKKRVTGALGSVHVPSPAAVMAHLPSSRPGTPSGEKSFDFGSWIPNSPSAASAYSAFTAVEAPRPPLSRTQTPTQAKPNPHSALSKSMVEQPTLARSVSQHVVSTSKNPNASSYSRTAQVPVSELSKLRQAYSAAVAKMDGMSKELGELKKGKVEMEAELENLSQALFEEANKMVADERRKRSEAEENLKEVKDEREALRQTIKVLGGKVEERASLELDPASSADEARKGERAGEGDAKGRAETAEEFVPRDLDKHYEALRKAVHHVADGAMDPNSPIASASISGSAPGIPGMSGTGASETSDLELSESDANPDDNDGGLSRSISSVIENDNENDTLGYMTTSVPNLRSTANNVHGLSVSLPAESNPWATSSSTSTSSILQSKIGLTITTPSPIPEGVVVDYLPSTTTQQEGEGRETGGDKTGEGEEQEPVKEEDLPSPQPVGLGLALDAAAGAGNAPGA